MKIAAGYIRVSTEDQVEYSPDSQRKLLVEYAKSHDMILPNEYIFSDEGISGRSAKRPEFQRMIGIAKQKPTPFEVILVWKFSRFARNREDSIVYKSMLRKQCGIDVVSISEPTGDDKMSVLIEALIEAMDEYYSINLAEETRRGMTERAKQGGAMGSPAYGYKVKDKQLIRNDETAPIVQKIFQDYVNGKPILVIAKELNSLGILTKANGKWAIDNIRKVLSNPTYIGTSHWTPNGRDGSITKDTISVENSHEPIIDKKTFEKAQEKLEKAKKIYTKNAHRNHGIMHPMKGIARCANCGKTLTLMTGRNQMQCTGYLQGVCQTSCSISKDKLYDMVILRVIEDIELERFKVSIDTSNEQSDNEQIYRAEIKKLTVQLERISEAYAAGVDTLEEYKRNKERVQSRIDTINDKIIAETPQIDYNSLKTTLTNSLEMLKTDIPDELKNEILRGIIEKVTLRRQNRTDIELMIFYKT